MRTQPHSSVETLEARRLMSVAANLTPTEVYGDFNRDGKADLATLDGGKLRLAAGLGDGRFAAADGVAQADRMRARSIAGGDVNGDGFADLFISGVRGTGANAKGIIAVLIGIADAPPMGEISFAFAQPLVTEVGLPAVQGRPLVGDFNGDGRDDLAGVREDGVIGWYDALVKNETLKELKPGGTLRTPYRAGGQIAVATDDDGGPDDILVINTNGRAFWSPQLGNSFTRLAGTWDDADIVYAAGRADAADFLVLRKGNVIAVEFDGLGDTGTHEVGHVVPAPLRRRVVAIDVDGNGTLDLLARRPGGRAWFVPDMDADQSGMA